VKRSGRKEPMWVAIHKCMEATPGISLYSHLKLAKMLCLSYYLLCFLLNKKTNMFWEGGRTIYTHVNKCKSDKIKGERNQTKINK
jgi:hypothetical protein